MRPLPPRTPIEALDLSSGLLKFLAAAVTKTAAVNPFWRKPREKASTLIEEMDLTDILYWTFKCVAPVTRPDKGCRDFWAGNKLDAERLPEGFQRQTSLSLGAAGDLLNTEHLGPAKDILFKNVADLLFEQDVSFANLEASVTTQPLVKEVISDREAPIECCSRQQFEILGGHKGKYFTVLNTANNHKADMGLEGVETTQKTLSECGILEIGTNRTREEWGKGRIMTVKGVKIGWAAATFGLNGRSLPSGEEYRINVANIHSKFVPPQLELIKQQIDHCKSEGCDFIIASIHWGYEFEFYPRAKQVEMAHELIEYGADSIIAHHPHVVQPVETYRTKRDPDRVAVIAYSMGTLTWGYFAPYLALSFILNLSLCKGTIDGQSRVYIEGVRVTPVFRRVIDNGRESCLRIERLADYMTRPEREFGLRDVAGIKRYAEQILGKRAA